MDKGSQRYFSTKHERTVYSAEQIAKHLFEIFPDIKSAVDVGSGVGTFLTVLMENGINDVVGLDGDWIDQNLLTIPKEKYICVDLTKPVKLERKFDLAISLEVGEHLPPESAEGLVKTLVGLSDIILFSAAIPGQGSRRHINEQWPEYWVSLFEKFGFEVFDIMRDKLWHDSKILVWYRQNILIFIKKSRASEFSILSKEENYRYRFPLSVVHPEMFESNMKKYTSIKGSWKTFRREVKKKLL